MHLKFSYHDNIFSSFVICIIFFNQFAKNLLGLGSESSFGTGSAHTCFLKSYLAPDPVNIVQIHNTPTQVIFSF
jgi:hypothetical protein